MFSIQRNKNLLEYFLDALNIKHTRAFARKLFEEHPHRFDMYGLHSMCLIYGIKTIGVSISTKNLNNLSYPCILHTTKDFVIATSCSSGIISYIDGGITKKESCENFKSSWTGNALIVSEFISAEEPNYSENIKNQRISDYSFYFILLSLLLVLVVGTFRNIAAKAYHIEMSVITSLLGIVICAILFEKQLYGYYYPVSIHDSKILFGNINARILITILSNPHCMPCAKLHEKVEQTLNNYGENICVQYICTSFNEEYYKSCKYLIGEYDSNNLNKTRKVDSEWYKSSREQKEETLVQVSEGIHKPSIKEEWQKHKEWYRKCHLSETPTILVNGFLLPSIYDLDDIMVLCEAFE